MKDILQWKQEVEKYNAALSRILDEKSNQKDLYYGFEVIDGKLIKNPEILFIGINPGRGNGQRDRNVFAKDRISYLDKYDDAYQEDYPNRYHLAEKTIKFFELAGWKDAKIMKVFSRKAVKTNFYHLATDNIQDLERVLQNVNLNKEYFNKSAEFSIQLINILKPKVIILEGKTVFDFIVEECYEKKVWNDKGFGYFFDQPNHSHILGYNRNISNENREYFVKKLKEVLEEDRVAVFK
ncbi:uracil-DNA glycosylase family protein [Salinimicrobium sediminilitoris]|uniref:uracil-DNA glycosylase family protein n=1 Tax=Salinimicrobium sediminilitoris TaxID=2876715 RepID=UPI001E33707F|nr:hypothetical protein [Salinimicrobium sediminilitoris]MCC8360659.1 hypothetical protein [Salinimicrobium sediminilitoris]